MQQVNEKPLADDEVQALDAHYAPCPVAVVR
jgi:hypothetical protein